MSIWVCPHCPKPSAEKEIEKIEGLARLYAYPCEPKFKNGGLVILDSGAFALSQSGRRMNFAYMKKLSEHYKKHYSENVICVAPDEFLNPVQSMINFKNWHKLGLFSNACPVLQCETKFKIDEKSILQQAEFYRNYSEVVFFSNPSLTAKESGYKLNKIFGKIKDMGYKWIHNLGAGWNLEDVKAWKNIENLDSFDSIAYYNTKNQSEFGSLDAVKNVKEILNV